MISPELSAVCSRAVDAKLGIVRRVAEIPLQPGEPKLFMLAANCTRPKYFLRNDTFHCPEVDYTVPASSVGLDRADALWRVLGEACERYAGGIYFDEHLVTACREELGPDALPVEEVIGFSHRQYEQPGFPFRRFDARAPVRWVEGRSLVREKRVFVPAALVYLGYEAVSPGEFFYPTLSTGMAAGRTLEQALLNGLCEVIERDAFMCTWLLRRAPQSITLESLRGCLSAREWALLENPRIVASVTLATTDTGVPAVLTVLRPRLREAAVVGAAAHPDVCHAVVHSLLEAYHTLNWAIFLERTPKTLERTQMRDFEDHVRYYLDACHFPQIDWLTRGAPVRAPCSASREDAHVTQLERALSHLKRAGYDACYVETTTTDVCDLGLRTVKVIVPGLHPLHVGCDSVHEDDRRLRRVASHWGIPMPTELNPEPHPFP